MRPVFRPSSTLPLVLLLALACQPAGGAPEPAPVPVAASARPLAALVTQQVVVAPLNALRAGGLDARYQARERAVMQGFDVALGKALAARGLGSQWVYPDALVRSARSNPTYAVDPYRLAGEPLRDSRFVAGMRFPDPLASQLRMMVALQESARWVLLPVELRFEPTAAADKWFAVLRLAVLDGRASDIRWIGDVRGDALDLSPTGPLDFPSAGLLASLAAHTADLIAAP